MLLCSGLTKFLRSRKSVNNLPSSWSPAVPAPTNAKQLKIRENKETKELRDKKDKKDIKNEILNVNEANTENTEMTGTDNKQELISLNANGNIKNNDDRENRRVRGRDERGDKRSNSIRSDVRTENSAPVRVDHVCIDMNQILHASFRSSADPSHCMAKVCTYVSVSAYARIHKYILYNCHYVV